MALIRTKGLGFTLIELMIVIAIIGILAAIAYPSYTNFIIRSNRTDAKTALSETAQRLERCFTSFNVYDSANCSVVFPVTSQSGFYTIAASTLTANTYTLAATPAKAPQNADNDCRTMTLTSAGVRSALDSGGAIANNCW